MKYKHYEVSQSTNSQHIDMKICLVIDGSFGVATFVFNDKLYSAPMMLVDSRRKIWNAVYNNNSEENPKIEQWGFKFDVSGARDSDEYIHSNNRDPDYYKSHIMYWIDDYESGIQLVQGSGTGTGGNTGGD